MPLQRLVRGCQSMRNTEEQRVPNALEVQPQGEVTHAEFREVIRRSSQVATYQVGQRDNWQEVADTLRIHEHLRINPLSFTGSIVTEDPENFIEELKNIFDVMHVVRRRGALMRSLIPRELQEAKIRDFLTLNAQSMSVHEYNLKFTQLSRYAPEMVVDLKRKMSLFVVELYRRSRKEGKKAMLIGDMNLGLKDKPAYSQGSMAQSDSKALACAWCGRNHQVIVVMGRQVPSSVEKIVTF
ncbi:uncharacterized protein LOC107003794 [Solanum pennellii]|uniref:Uncharacterized protein LOC107003794 n=1 Tax=Solanum pennellii TaxID=28526 RepID=A0ABM1FJ04_SOLPN|nr:uncharacterized protein LOC107003794 [Solanum pennellii]